MTKKITKAAFEPFHVEIEKRAPQFAAALPDHIPLDRFKRVVLTAVSRNPELLDADRRSLFDACTLAAQDGLLPDGREAAFVIFKEKNKKTGLWVKKVQYMPMIAGVLKKCRNSGQLAAISANVVYEHDDFDYELGDNERIYHKPNLSSRGMPMGAYAIAHLKNGMVEREFMTTIEIEDVRKVSRAAEAGPWVQWWGEMARKTVLRRLSKRLPMSTDLETLMHRDDDLYDLDQRHRELPPRPDRRKYIAPPERDMDAEYRAATTGYVGDDPASAAPTDNDQGRDAASPPTPGPAGEVADGGGQLPLGNKEAVEDDNGHVLLVNEAGNGLGNFKRADDFFAAIIKYIPQSQDPENFLERNQRAANVFVSRDEKWMDAWNNCHEAARAAQARLGERG